KKKWGMSKNEGCSPLFIVVWNLGDQGDLVAKLGTCGGDYDQLGDDMEGLGCDLYKLEDLEYKVDVFGWPRLTWSKRERCGHFKDQEMDFGACKKLVDE
nr:hypothetical protein [Tanacetum cinerariifolium]